MVTYWGRSGTERTTTTTREIGDARGLRPWLDEWQLRPGHPWQQVLEHQIDLIKSAAVFVGRDGIGPWQNMEIDAFLRHFVQRKAPIIPVLLPNATEATKLPTFLANMTWVDFRKSTPAPMEQLYWGVTGERHYKNANDIAVELTGREVRCLREFLGLSQAALAQLSGETTTMISNYERGRKASPEAKRNIVNALRRQPGYRRIPVALE